MATIVDCPTCTRKLRVPDELLGKKVKCPTCSGTFDAMVAPAPAGAGSSSGPAEPRLSLDDGGTLAGASKTQPRPPGAGAGPPDSGAPSPAPPVSSENPPGAVPSSEQETLSHFPSQEAPEEDLEPCPYCGEKIARDATRCTYCKEDLEDDVKSDRPWDRGYRPYRDVRRDSEPHRGTLILVLGIVSIVSSSLSVCSYGLLGIIGLVMGICVWVMGQKDLKKMRSNQMDPQGQGSTQAGWICGIIGTVFGALGFLFFVAAIGFFIVMAQSASKLTPPPTPPSTVRPVAPVGPRPVQKNAPVDPPPVQKKTSPPSQKKQEQSPQKD